MPPPLTFTMDVALTICSRMAQGESLRSICRTKGMPAEQTVRRWALEDHEGFMTLYARARELQAHAWADELLEIADDGRNDWMEREDPANPGWTFNSEHVQRSRLRLDTRKWLASKILPKQYSDRNRALSATVPGLADANDLAGKIAALLAAVTDGTLAPEEATAVAGLLEAQRKIVEVSLLEERVRALEQAPRDRR